MFKRNSLAFGAMLAAVIPAILFLLIEKLFTVERDGVDVPRYDEATILVLSIFANILPFSYYMKHAEYEKTGRGMLLVTFIYAAIYIFVKFIREQ
jgi:hypothetical protein